MSPEQLRSLRSVDCRTDIWALGVILFEMLVGTPPFEGDTLPDLSVKIIVTEPPLLRSKRPDAPHALEAIISRCLEKEVTKRVADIAELAGLLAPFGTLAAAGSLERINKVFAPTSSPTLTSSQRISIRDPHSSSNPIILEAEGVARTEVAWDTLRDPSVNPAKRKAPYLLIGLSGAVLFTVLSVAGIVYVSNKMKPVPPPVAGPAIASETAATASTTPLASAPLARAAAAASSSVPEANAAPDAGIVVASTKPLPTAAARPQPPKPPPTARPSAAPAVSVPAPKSTAPTGVTLDRHG
jgi:serine/threonine-protein kinase